MGNKFCKWRKRKANMLQSFSSQSHGVSLNNFITYNIEAVKISSRFLWRHWYINSTTIKIRTPQKNLLAHREAAVHQRARETWPPWPSSPGRVGRVSRSWPWPQPPQRLPAPIKTSRSVHQWDQCQVSIVLLCPFKIGGYWIRTYVVYVPDRSENGS